MLRNVYFEGEMGHKFLPHMQIHCETPAEVFRCLDANFPDFMSYLVEKHEEDVGFHIEVAGEELEYVEECLMTIGKGDIIITPIPSGSGKGFGKILAAIAIVVLTIGTAGFTAPFTTAAFGSVAAGGAVGGILTGSLMAKIATGIALNLALTGLAEMMAPDPSVDSEIEAQQSYLFNGPQQNIAQGDPVPVVYGRLRVPGQPISFEIVGSSSSLGGDLTTSSGGTIGQGMSNYFTQKELDLIRSAT